MFSIATFGGGYQQRIFSTCVRHRTQPQICLKRTKSFTKRRLLLFFKFAMKLSTIILLLLYHLIFVNASIFTMATGTVTRGTTTKLFQPWEDNDFEGILVRISEHSDSKYSWLHELLNCTFPDATITTKEMCDLDFFVDEKIQDEVSEDIVDKVKTWYSKHIFTTLGGTADQDDIDSFLNLCSPSFKLDKVLNWHRL